jgi:hypothetical protein
MNRAGPITVIQDDIDDQINLADVLNPRKPRLFGGKQLFECFNFYGFHNVVIKSGFAGSHKVFFLSPTG